jgi:hypothetical protein
MESATMTTPIVLTGGETAFGIAIDNTGTDNFFVTGAKNTINEDGGNLIVNGGNFGAGYDTSTTINLGSADEVIDQITLDGGKNTVQATAPGDYLDESTIVVLVTGKGLAKSAHGHNVVNLENLGGYTSVSLTGAYNNVTLNSNSTNTIVAGGSYATISVGTKGDQSFDYSTIVKLVGTHNAVDAGDQNNIITGVASFDTISVGDGDNTIALKGITNLVKVGTGTNNIALGGSGNEVLITDRTGLGTDNITVGNRSDDVLQFGDAGGSVSGSHPLLARISQNASAVRVLNIDLNNGQGIIALGNGSDAITASGPTSVSAGNGNDVVKINGGGGAYVNLGGGSDVVLINGEMDQVTLGDGNDTCFAKGARALVTVGDGNDNISASGYKSIIIAGNGNDTVSMTGAASRASINAVATSHDTVAMGSGDAISISSGVDQMTGIAYDNIYANAMQINSGIQLAGNNNVAFIGTDSSVNIFLNPAQTGDQITIQGDVGDTYSGIVDISFFNQSDLMTLNGLTGGITHAELNSFSSVLANITTGPDADILHLGGGGEVVFSPTTVLMSSEFAFGTQTGPV